MLRTRTLLAALVGVALLAGPPLALRDARAQTGSAADPTAGSEASGDPVVAVVNGKELHQSDVLRSAQDLPPQMQAQIGALFPALVERLVDLTLLSQAGRDAGLAADERVERLVADAEEDAIRRVYLEDKIEAALGEEELQEAYTAYVAENPAAEEIKARHILLENEEDAAAVIEELEQGGDFEQLARDRSTGPSAPQGGDLGWFTQDQMVQPFSEAAFELQPGAYTETPVETQFGWHVILVEDRREKPAPSFEEVEEELREQVARGVIDEEVQRLRGEAEIELPQPAAPAESAPAEPAPAETAPAEPAPAE